MEYLNVELIETGKRMTVPDSKPLSSASLYLETSNEIWQRKPEGNMSALSSIESKVAPLEARTEINATLDAIHPLLGVGALKSTLTLKDPYSKDEIRFDPDFFTDPSYASVETFNWDESGKNRRMMIHGKVEAVEFTDGHLDYMRELGASFQYEKGDRFLNVTHAIQRSQPVQNKRASITTNVWFNEFAETGYEGSVIASVEMTAWQEIAFLRVVRRMAGLAIDGTKSVA